MSNEFDASPVPKSDNWERATLEKLAFAALTEQRKSRQWSILFKVLTFVFLFLLLFSFLGWVGGQNAGKAVGPHTAMVSIDGVIGPGGPAAAENIIEGLQRAFEDSNTKGIVLRINSPGGSPVHSGYVNDEIKRLRAKHKNIPVYAVVEDICASGGYYIAVAADRIYVDKASLIGSVGVLMDGFGFTGVMEKIGVERRLLAAGENKGFLDPFSPVTEEQKAFAQSMLGEIHQQFIKVVREGRGTRLKETPDMFTGLVWTGEKSLELGLADALGSTEYVAREIIKADNVVDFTPEENLAERFARQLGAGSTKALVEAFGGGKIR